MTTLRVIPFGAAREVGRSCVLVQMQDVNVLLDCGAHLAYHDSRRFPDFGALRTLLCSQRLAQKSDGQELGMDALIDAVLITHFHLDHVGALPVFTEHIGYTGPVYMTVRFFWFVYDRVGSYKKYGSYCSGGLYPTDGQLWKTGSGCLLEKSANYHGRFLD